MYRVDQKNCRLPIAQTSARTETTRKEEKGKMDEEIFDMQWERKYWIRESWWVETSANLEFEDVSEVTRLFAAQRLHETSCLVTPASMS